MEKSITLPKSGATVVFRDIDELRQKDREKMWAMFPNEENQILRIAGLLKGLMVVLIKSWTLDMPIPSVLPEALGELAIDDYDALATYVGPMAAMYFPDFVKGEDNPDSPKDNLKDLPSQ